MSSPERSSSPYVPPTPVVEQAWALPVDIATLGGHLSAYITLRPAIETLRLCNRFGSSEKAITTLPPELLEQVEQHLLEDESERERKAWAQEQRCAEGDCHKYDHIDDPSPRERHQVYHDMQEAGDFEYSEEDRLCETQGRRNFTHSQEHIARQGVKVKERLQELKEHGPRDVLHSYICEFRDACHSSQKAWKRRTARAAHRSSNGLLGTTMSKVLLKDFGLQIRIIHGLWTFDQPGDNDWQRHTTAYLLLPLDEGSSQVRGNAPVPTYQQLARFGRAVRMLALNVVTGPAAMDETKEYRFPIRDRHDTMTVPKDISIEQQPRVVTFSEFADHCMHPYVWAWYYRPDPDFHWMDFEDTDWMWAVVNN
ncbi:unnamed protein product [Zymoseptoria tritici ST99CH_3D1]|nr:unnamed protein product [Zymoseptoria tritici ST99CH_3D1]